SRIRVSSPVKVVELSFGEANSPKTKRVKSCPTIRFPFAPCQIARCRAIGLSICPMNGPAQRANQRESDDPAAETEWASARSTCRGGRCGWKMASNHARGNPGGAGRARGVSEFCRSQCRADRCEAGGHSRAARGGQGYAAAALARARSDRAAKQRAG